ncbi:TPA: right-handed parallel beta-helix repeat-containing protein [Kluyvera georgiana]|uniref:right-handed parallel beta-helix repeat-containing protein n=1 Tax=Kluyvera georgiana TaxID=73098 RepID=UPI0008071860|nr:right-handed parallel beta-helix repeat-containing protein [Kluyvera georgiana]HDG1688652.1 right-handed parallel beta-helix repeat-containing protein [Kluyvera georgiana]HED1420741.1 right-handed parallel beta-helix repeat-containing protein [Kluyvera georgiana]
MNKKIPLALTLCSAALSLSAQAQTPQQWKAIAFGQSTDVNFSSNVLPEKVGVNNVTIDGKTLTPQQIADLSKPITIESRGGKIANSHDGLTFFYTTLPSDENFVLSATVTVDQFGPENGAKPAAQEGAGLLVRDIIGIPRQEPLKEGYEEFPAASNMVMNAIMTQDKKDSYRVKLQAIARNGITQPWGNAGSEIKKVSYKEGVDLRQSPTFRLKLERTNDGFVTAWAPVGSEEWVAERVPHADMISVQDKKQYYVGFFASRNAKITVKDASLTTSEAKTVASKPFVAKSWPVVMQVASGSKSLTPEYTLQARANYDGLFTVRHNEVVIGENKAVKAGEMFTQPATLKESNTFQVTFTPTSGKDRTPVEQQLTVNQQKGISTSTLYAAANGKTDAKGTADAPMDLQTAIDLVAPGGKIVLAAGDYPKTDIPLSASGLEDGRKTLEANGKAVIHGMLLDGNYWTLRGVDITGKSLRIQGSHNLIENVTAYRNDDTGIQISSVDKIGRPLWASYNRVVNSESHSNEDPGKINADGFAVKMRVGEGNRLEGCYSHNNIDDGFDLFNKIEDGANGVVVIENSVARDNTSNGFKLGGEGQPVAHEIRNSIAIGNHLDGFTDNFNPGKLVVVNNVAVDNQRFNFIFRPSPYGDASTQGVFSDNISLRSKPGKYDDAVVGNIDATNYFIEKGKSVNTEGKELRAQDFQSLSLPQPLTRNADGSFDTGNFLTKD